MADDDFSFQSISCAYTVGAYRLLRAARRFNSLRCGRRWRRNLILTSPLSQFLFGHHALPEAACLAPFSYAAASNHFTPSRGYITCG